MNGLRNRLYLPSAAALLLVFIAACSGPAPVRAPEIVSVHAGLEHVQVHWSHPLNREIAYAIQYRAAGSSGDWSGWQQPARVDELEDRRSALVGYPAGKQLQFRVGAFAEGQWLWSASSVAVSRPDGVALQVGSLDRGLDDGSAGTVFLLLFDLEHRVAGPVDLWLSGPPGWDPENRSPGIAVSVDAEQLAGGYLLQHFHGLDLVPGTYEVRLTDYRGGEWRQQLRLEDTSFRLPAATGLQLHEETAALRASWVPPVASAHTNVSLHGPDGPLTGYPTTTADSYPFLNVELPAAEVRLDVTVTNWVPTGGVQPVIVPVPFGAASSSRTFTVGD